MEIKGSKKSNRASNPNNPDNSLVKFKGQKGAACLVCGNMPKDGESMAEKATGIIVDSYMRRPALSVDAMDAIFKRTNDCILVGQNPQYPTFASMSGVFFIKNKFIMAAAGDNVVFHFVDGVLKDVFTGDSGSEPAYLGNVRFTAPKVSDQVALGKGENTFLIASKKFAEAFSEDDLEDALHRATHTTQKGKAKITEVKCDRWLSELWDGIGDKSNDEYSAIAFSLPQKQRSLKKLIIGIIIAVVVIAAAVFALGFFTRGRGPEPPKEGDPSMTEPLFAPGEGGQYDVTGPNGEQAPAPPTRPPQS